MSLDDSKRLKSATDVISSSEPVADKMDKHGRSASAFLDETARKLQEAGATFTPERATSRVGESGKNSASAAAGKKNSASAAAGKKNSASDISKHLISRIEQSLDVTLEDVVDHLVALKKEAKKEGREFTAQDREKALRKISEAARNPDSPATKALAEKIRSHRLPEWKPIKMGPEFFFSTPDNIRHLPGADQFVQKMGERFPNPGSANSADIELAGKKLVAYIKAGLSMDSFDFDAPIVDVPKAEKAPTYDLSAWRKDADNFMKAWRAEAQATMQQAAQQHGGLKARAEQNKAQRDAKIAEIVAGTSSNSKFRAPPVPPAAPESPKDGREQPAPSNVVAAKLQMEETTEPTVSEKSAAAEDLAVKVANDSKGPTVSQPSNAGSEQNLKGVIRGASPMSADGLRVNNADSVSFVKSIQRQVASMIDVAVRVALGFLGKLGAKGIEHSRVADVGEKGQMAANGNLAETEARLEAAGVRLDQQRAKTTTPNAAVDAKQLKGINEDLVQNPEFKRAVDALAATNQAAGAELGEAQQHELGAVAQQQQQSSRCR